MTDLDALVAETLGRSAPKPARSSSADARVEQLVSNVFGREVEFPEELGALSPEQSGRVERFAAKHRITSEAAHSLLRGRSRTRAALAARDAKLDEMVINVRGGVLQ
ncbi:MAG: hypothetical protein K0S65_789 [Labilithrix sp.]|jgi:hypothetical protein|nr:hypothetical protein [Labilithrix sp.]